MKIILTFFLTVTFFSFAVGQYTIKGKVIRAMDGNPIEDALITFTGSDKTTKSDMDGLFHLNVNQQTGKLVVSKDGFDVSVTETSLPLTESLIISLENKTHEIEEVKLTTGYQVIPKERATGSFTAVNSKIFNQQVSTNVIDRLPASAASVLMDNGTRNTSNQLMIRGLSTIRGNRSPLIILDNFPYEGDINNINPNTVENITILRDAAAASIWGARAGNGVIVITTKSPSNSQSPKINLVSTTSVVPRPDLDYISQMTSSDYIEMEKVLFSQGFYNSDLTSSSRPVVSPVVDLLDKVKKGIVSQVEADRQIEIWQKVDVRDDFKKYMYKPAINNQHALDFAVGNKTLFWLSSLGYDRNQSNLGDNYERLNLNLKNRWHPFSRLSINTGIYFTEAKSSSGRLGYDMLTMKSLGFVPYMQMADASGNALPVYKGYSQEFKLSFGNKLLDWSYYPLTDWQNNVGSFKTTDVIFSTGINLKLFEGLETDVKYQHQVLRTSADQLYNELSYIARDLVNTYTQLNSNGNINYGLPVGGIFSNRSNENTIKNLRGQINYNGNFGKHHVSAIAGSEIRDNRGDTRNSKYYGFNENDLSFGNISYDVAYPRIMGGSSFITDENYIGKTTNRFVSLFANAAYTFNEKYILSASSRRDASNLFGLKTNDQWNPFWSAGAAWNVSKEKFYKLNWLPSLKIRMTYGFSGNINPGMSAVTTILYSPRNSAFTGEKVASVDNYYNPNLRWETIETTNLGIDFSLKNNRLLGALEYFTKKGDDLFGPAPIDYTAGASLLTWNVAGMKGRGIDVSLKSLNIDKDLRWSSILNVSTFKDKITKYHLNTTSGSQFVLPSVPISGVEGLPVYSVFAYKWGGLDPNTGDPMGYLNGELSKDYTKLLNADVKDLQFFGSAIPTTYGSFINNFSFQNFSLDVGITYKLNYWFRRSSINYTNLLTGWVGHGDYAQRWQKPGDELITNVPSNIYKTNSNRDTFYNRSSVLIEKGDHIRLQYINFNYSFSDKYLKSLPVKDLQLRFNISNVGLLWKANKSGLDPDYNFGNYHLIMPVTYSFGINTKF